MSVGPGTTEWAAPGAKPGGIWRRGWLWLLLIVAAYLALFVRVPRAFFALGVNHVEVNHHGVWFLDTYALLAASDAVAEGMNPYAANPLDYLQRSHVYSHWWLYLRDAGLTRADTWWLGLLFVLGFLSVALWRLRPQTGRQLFWYAAVVCSSPLLLALDRANNDLVIFVLLAPVVPCLLSKRRMFRYLAATFIALAALLKYYPAAAALVMLFVLERKELRPRLLFTALCLAFAGAGVVGDLKELGLRAPHPAGLLSFGAMGFFDEVGWTGWLPRFLGLAAAVAVVGVAWWQRALGPWAPRPDQRSDWLHFLLGAVLLTGCFFTSMNFGYRWIFSIWLAPFLWKMPRDVATPRAWQRLTRVTFWLLVLVLWWGTFSCLVLNRLIGMVDVTRLLSVARWAFLLEQPMDWAFFLCLLIFLTQFARTRLAPPV